MQKYHTFISAWLKKKLQEILHILKKKQLANVYPKIFDFPLL